MKTLFQALIVLLPWAFKRRLLQWCFHYDLHPTARIGWAWVFPVRLVMAQGASIGHLSVCKGLALVQLGAFSSIGRLNWITGHPLGDPRHFVHLTERRPQLLLAEHAALTNRHIVDCTECVSIGRFATVAGMRSQLLSHSIDLAAGRQHAKPITIGAYTFVGTACTVLGGTVLPDYSVLGAASLLRNAYEDRYRLYAGVPAKPVAQLDPNLRYFTRTEGYVL